MARFRVAPETAIPRGSSGRETRQRRHRRTPRGAPLSAYFDSSVISKFYIPEADSDRAFALRRDFSPPVPLTAIHRLELINAWQLKVFRGEIASKRAAAARQDLRDDLDAEVWSMIGLDLEAVSARAETLVVDHTGQLGTRSLDVLHVATALVLGCTDFVTGDPRQARLAERTGLQVRTI